jgi:hypothetical protein
MEFDVTAAGLADNASEILLPDNATVYDDGSACAGADDVQLSWYLNFAWWLEGFLQLVTGSSLPLVFKGWFEMAT